MGFLTTHLQANSRERETAQYTAATVHNLVWHTFIHLHCALSWHCLYNQNSTVVNMNPKMRCKMVQGWVFVSHMQKKTSVNFSKLHSAAINPSEHKYKCRCTRHYSNAGTQVSSLLGCDTTLSGKHLVLPSSSGSRSPKTDVYDIRVETGQ